MIRDTLLARLKTPILRANVDPDLAARGLNVEGL